MDSLSKRISTFTYDPEEGLTFDLWFSRYENVFEQDAKGLDDAAKVRLLIQRLDQIAFKKYAAHILPQKCSELTFAVTVGILRELFGHRGSLFARRYQCVQILCEEHSEGSFDDYTGMVNQRFELAEMA